MNDIKFRGQRVDNKEWVYGFYREQPSPLKCVGESEPPKSYIIFENPNCVSDWGMPIQMVECEVIPETVVQCTVLKDKTIWRNKIMLYEIALSGLLIVCIATLAFLILGFIFTFFQ